MDNGLWPEGCLDFASEIKQGFDATTLGRQRLCDTHRHLLQMTLTSDLGDVTRDRSLGVLSKNFLTSPVTYSRTCHKLFFLFLTPPLSFSEERTNKQQAQNSNMGGSHESVNQRREVSFPKRTTKWWVHCINRHKTHNSVLLRKSPMGAAGKFHVALSFSWAKC